MTGGRWSIPKAWPGARVFIVGGGRSLKGFDWDRLKGQGKIIAINNAGLAPAVTWADMLYFADGRWLSWNASHIEEFKGPFLVTRTAGCSAPHRPVMMVGRDLKNGLSKIPTLVAGECSGANALNIAYHMGASEVYLLGIDMRSGYWHDGHKVATRDRYAQSFIPAFERMAGVLRHTNTKVWNCSPISALKAFQYRPLDEVISN